jgi:hypothetical protein
LIPVFLRFRTQGYWVWKDQTKIALNGAETSENHNSPVGAKS